MFSPEEIEFTINEATEEAYVRVGEETYQIRFDFGALYTVYKAFGFNPAIDAIGTDPMRWSGLLWAGLLRFQPDVEPEAVFSWYNAATCLKLYEGTMKALRLALPKSESKEEAPDPRSA